MGFDIRVQGERERVDRAYIRLSLSVYEILRTVMYTHTLFIAHATY